MRSLGIDVGATNVKWVVLEAANGGRVLAEGSERTRGERGPQVVLRAFSELAHRLIAEHGIERIGLGLPGPLDLRRGRTVFLANMPGWKDVPVVQPLAAAAGLPVALVNDARAFTLGEFQLGAGRGASTMIGVTLGTGVGGGIIVNGQLLLDLNGTAGEIGHQTLEPSGPPCGCGNHGCLEQFASGPAIARAAGAETAEQVVEAARAGDAVAREALAHAGRYLGIGIANVVLTVAPEAVVIGGGVAEAGELILEPTRQELARRVKVMPVEQVRVVRAELGQRAGAIGAALWGAGVASAASFRQDNPAKT